MRNNGPCHSDEHAGVDRARQHAGRHVAVQDMDLLGLKVEGPRSVWTGAIHIRSRWKAL